MRLASGTGAIQVMSLFDWFKALRAVVKNYATDMRALRQSVDEANRTLKAVRRRMDKLDRLIRERTDIAVDVRFGEPNYVIVVGRYKNADYVQTYSVKSDDLGYLVDMLKNMERHAQVRIVDAPPGMKTVVRSFV